MYFKFLEYRICEYERNDLLFHDFKQNYVLIQKNKKLDKKVKE